MNIDAKVKHCCVWLKHLSNSDKGFEKLSKDITSERIKETIECAYNKGIEDANKKIRKGLLKINKVEELGF